MRRWQKIIRNRKLWLALAIVALLCVLLRTPGTDLRDGRHDRGRNGLALCAAWIADDPWFDATGRASDKSRYREGTAELGRAIRENHIAEVFLEIPPPDGEGALHGLDAARTEALLYECYESRTWARIAVPASGVADLRWRRFFLVDLRRLLDRHPRLQGVQLDCSRIADGEPAIFALIDELGPLLAPDRRLVSIIPGAWGETCFREAARRADGLAITLDFRSSLAARLTPSKIPARIAEAHARCEGRPVLFRIPGDDRLRRALRALHLGLGKQQLPEPYQGILIETADAPTPVMWRELREHFLQPALAK